MDFGLVLMSYPNCWEDAAFAEQHGFDTVGFVDSPTLAGDPFVCMALAAARTERLRIGPCLAIPGLRSPQTTASALATVNSLAPGRVFFAAGSGSTGRLCQGYKKPVSASKMRDYAEAVRGLLRGELACHSVGTFVERVRIKYPKGLQVDPTQPIPIYLGADGPQALKAAGEAADGLVAALSRGTAMENSHDVLAASLEQLQSAAAAAGRDLADCYVMWPPSICVLRPGESVFSPRVLRAAGPIAMLVFHKYVCDPEMAESLPPLFRDKLETYEREVVSRIEVPREYLYQEIHAGHLSYLLDGEAAVLTEELLRLSTLIGSPEEIAAQLKRLEAAGLKNVSFSLPPSIVRETILDVEAKIMPLMNKVLT